MRICCLDQSSKITGYSIWNHGELSEFGTICVDEKDTSLNRACDMYGKIKELISNSQPDYVCLEDTQFQKNPKVLKVLAQLQGMVFAILADADIGFCIVEPSSWKSFIGIKAKKRNEQKLETIEKIKAMYNISELTEDEADSIAIGHWAINNLTVKRKEETYGKENINQQH